MTLATLYQHKIQRIQERLPRILRGQHLPPFIKWWALTEKDDTVMLLCRLDHARFERFAETEANSGRGKRLTMRDYHSPDILHALATGRPDETARHVFPMNSVGWGYSFVLNEGRAGRLPEQVALPELMPGRLLIGEDPQGRLVSVAWREAGHLLVAGMTRSGKSSFDRSVVYQALAENCQLAIVDTEGTTFPMLKEHPALLTPAVFELERIPTLLAALQAEHQRRKELLEAAPNYPENIDDYNAWARANGQPALRRLLVVLEEYTYLVNCLGGPEGDFARATAALAQVGLKWGLTLLISGQEFTVKTTGRIALQCRTRLCFQVSKASTSKAVLDSLEAAALPSVSGRCLVSAPNYKGRAQAYYLDKTQLIELTRDQATRGGLYLTLTDRHIITAIGTELFNIENLQRLCGLSERAARRLVEEWNQRGWAVLQTRPRYGRYLSRDVLRAAGYVFPEEVEAHDGTA